MSSSKKSEPQPQEDNSQQLPASVQPAVATSDSAAEKQANIAKKLVTLISPIIHKEIVEKRITFVGLSVVVDNNYSITFPFHAKEEPEMTPEAKTEAKEARLKAIMLGALEYARTSGNLKRSAVQAFDEALSS